MVILALAIGFAIGFVCNERKSIEDLKDEAERCRLESLIAKYRELKDYYEL